MPVVPQSAQQRVESARRRERQARERAALKREQGNGLLARLLERSAEHQAATARFVESFMRDESAPRRRS